MADNRLNKTGLQYFYNRLKTIFATQTALNTLSGRVDEIVSEGGEPNIIESVKVNGTALPVDTTDKSVNISVPTAVSALTNDSGFQTSAEVQSAIDTAIGDITSIDYKVVTTLPATGEKGVIYLISNSGSAPNIYDEYIWTGTAFEKIGSTDVDLTGYFNETNLPAITTAEIDTIIDGE